MGLSLSFAPLIPWWLLIVLAVAAIVLLGLALITRTRATWLRALMFGALGIVLANPSLVQENRESLSNIVLLAVDKSPSMSIGERQNDSDRLVDGVLAELEELDNVDVRMVPFGEDSRSRGTELRPSLSAALADVPEGRLGGVFVVGDGQVNNEAAAQLEELNAPFHGLVVGEDNERDRRLTIVKAPRFGLVDQSVDVVLRVDDLGHNAEAATGSARVDLFKNGVPIGEQFVPIGSDVTLTLDIDQAGRNLYEIKVASRGDQDLTFANNAAVIDINGVRERLRVLLVSGQPHQAERTWRNILKSDPSVDLVHFTILRPVEKRDATPVNELSLIAFPVRELFLEKLHDFDLVILDQYPRRGILPPAYFLNIADYVRVGGALLVANGPAYANARSIYNTPLQSVLPAAPNGVIHEEAFMPQISDVGDRHPITSRLTNGYTSGEGETRVTAWGRWLRLVEADALSLKANAHVLMTDENERPLLLAARFQEGRVVQLMSDQLWLWARGFEGGGPNVELLRRTAHWLMGEPNLEEEQLTGSVQDGLLSITQRSLGETLDEVTIISPSGARETLTLENRGDGSHVAKTAIKEDGLYRLENDGISSFAVSGTLNPKEFEDARSSVEPLTALFGNAGGTVRRLAGDAIDRLGVRAVNAGARTFGTNWLGVADRGAYRVLGLKSRSLTPPLLALLGLLLLLGFMWWREGK